MTDSLYIELKDLVIGTVRFCYLYCSYLNSVTNNYDFNRYSKIFISMFDIF
jgi:hypothetical protein